MSPSSPLHPSCPNPLLRLLLRTARDGVVAFSGVTASVRNEHGAEETRHFFSCKGCYLMLALAGARLPSCSSADPRGHIVSSRICGPQRGDRRRTTRTSTGAPGKARCSVNTERRCPIRGPGHSCCDGRVCVRACSCRGRLT